ncbi:unnamed protein product [Paramecium primaurelia]|uniref:Uncharacterized protein n=1 Tax=Paramecium primaurelia TaxID=5886 RepID=A0A8S1L1V0_PARPR|nr:unnamed protein product [Paramecium primaurelia]
MAPHIINYKIYQCWFLLWEGRSQYLDSVVTTSGFIGEGIPYLLPVIVKYTSAYMKNKLKLRNFKEPFILGVE